MTGASNRSAWLRVQLLGPPQWRSPDGPVHRLSIKDAALIAVLALDGPQHRDRLTSLLWPDTSPASAGNSLRQRAFRLKRAAGVDVVRAGEFVQLAPHVHVDVHTLFSSDEDLLAALRSELLPGMDVAMPCGWTEWLRTHRERFSVTRRDAAIQRITHCEHEGDLAQAICWARRLIDADPLSEFAGRRLMRLHCARGDRAAALATYDRLEQLIREELGTHPDEETLDLMRAIEASVPTPAVRASVPLPGRLNHPPRFIGRRGVLSEIDHAWACARLAWIEGPVGSGKSRLLEELAWRPGVKRFRLMPADGFTPGATLYRLMLELGQLSTPPAVVSTTHGADAPQLIGALRKAMAAGMTALLIDDLQHADLDSLNDLASTLHTLLPLGLSAAVAVGLSPDGSRLDFFHRSFASRHGQVRIRMPMLEEAQMVELIESVQWPGESPAMLAADLMTHTGGNPWFALETLKTMHLLRKSEPGRSWPPLEHWASISPNAVLDACRVALSALTPLQRALARLACAWDDRFSLEQAAELLGHQPMDLVDAWVVLESSGICRGNRISSVLMQQAVQSLTPEELFEGHLNKMTRQHCVKSSGHGRTVE